MNGNIYIVGHRGTGKSTAAQIAGKKLGVEVVDLDEAIEAGEGMSCAEIIADSEARFRRLEQAYLAEMVDQSGDHSSDKPRIFSLGGGCWTVPDDGVCVWLYRDGWQEVAAEGRAQLRPDDDIADELAWMVSEREPRWEEAAHLRLNSPRGRRPRRTGADLATHLGWLLELADSNLAKRTWVVPAGPDQLGRAARDAAMLGLAGVEVRSDLMDAEAADDLSVPVLASLRTPDAKWLTALDEPRALDVDIEFLDDVLAAGTLVKMRPRRLLLSWHPPEPAAEQVDRLVFEAAKVAAAHPAWADRLVIKYAPVVDDYADLLDVIDADERLREAGHPVTTLPQGARFAWCRPPLAVKNATNYVPVGLGPQRRRHTDNPVETPLDLQGWLPHLAGPQPTSFEALIGDPVEASQGDVWHRRRARAADQRRSYLKIPFGRDDATLQLDYLLQAAESLGVHGMSVTSPLKRKVLEAGRVDNPEGLSAANTLRVRNGNWQATDTDQAGMQATLTAAEDAGVEPGTVAIIGRGGVSPAVSRAIEESNWHLVHHASGREGWTDQAPDEVQMVVNAAGDADTAYTNPPACKVWVDLHYTGVRPPPDTAEAHFNGDAFFDAQAAAQRAFWYSKTNGN